MEQACAQSDTARLYPLEDFCTRLCSSDGCLMLLNRSRKKDGETSNRHVDGQYRWHH